MKQERERNGSEHLSKQKAEEFLRKGELIQV